MEEAKKKVVMVAIDESECSRRALEWCLNFLKETIASSHLVVFTSLPPLDLGYIYASTYGATPAELVNSMQESQKKTASALLEDAKEMCAKHGLVPETIMEMGSPKDKICDAVDQLDVDLLVMGSHGRGALQRAFLGSVSNYCVQNAKCPVLVVRKPA